MSLKILHRVMNIIKEQNDVIVYDPTSVNFNTFEFTNGYTSYKISKVEIERPDLLSFTFYGTTQYAYFILRVNNIFDLDCIVPDSEIKIPNIIDIKKFIFDNEKEL